jgi:hypothetical protein
VRAGGAEIEASDAVFRLENGLSVILAVYAGEATVLGSGVDPVPALRQANVISGDRISRGFQPLQVRPNDPWDAEILGEAIELGRRLGYLERGLTHQLPRGHEAQAVSSVLESDFGRRAIESAITSLGNAARAVVAAVVAQEAVRIDGGSRSQILQEVVNLQVLGATWIVIVAQWGLAGAASILTQHVGALASAIAESVAPPPAPSTTSSTSPGTSRASVAGNTSTNGGRSGNPGNTKSAKPPPPPPPEGSGDEAQSPSCSGTVDCAVGDILDGGPGSP